MFGLLSQKSNCYLNDIEQNQEFGFDSGRLSFGGGGGIGISNAGVSSTPPLVGSNSPTQQFDISVLSGKRDSDRYGRNLVGDIRSSYETYISGTPIGKGGQFAVDAARRYGTTITEAARGYLVTAGLPTLAQIISPTPTPKPTPTPITLPDPKEEDFFGLPVGPIDVKNNTVTKEVTKNPFELLVDVIPKLFGNAVYNPPLQNQSSGFTGLEQGTPLAESTGEGGIGIFIILAIVGVIGYFLYKRFA